MLRETKVENGRLRGLAGSDPRITVYKGIPFAAPPVGENRFRAPQPAADWKGVYNAFEFGPLSVQDRPGMGTDLYSREWHVDNGVKIDEDCLYLNVWTPAKTGEEKLPVLIWYFGGGFQWGYTSEMEFDAEKLARRGIVVVSVNYRLNCFGYLAHPEITKENPDAPGNFGLLDQQAGLFWVHRNIAAFGGDPDKITISGQSAGGGSVLQQLSNKKSAELIKGAFIMSGMIRHPDDSADIFKPLSLDQAEKHGEEFFDSLGVSTLAEARKLDFKEIFDGYNRFVADHPRMFPIHDGQFCTGNPIDIIASGKGAQVPIVSGNTEDEFLIDGTSIVENSVKETYLDLAKNGSNQNMFYYRFCPDIPGDGDEECSHPGTFHSCDLWFFFESLGKCHRPYEGRHFELARQMCDYFANFVKYGDPNGKGWNKKPLPKWEPYTDKNRSEMEFAPYGATPKKEGGIRQNTKKQAVNPYLPSWEYVPDGEPYVFGDRVYVYGSHDLFDGETFCLGDYVGWSAPVNDLGNWHYEGIIYDKTQDPLNSDGSMCLYAPDVTVGPDGKYYLYYVLDKVCVVSVAVSDTPAGPFKFYGYVHYEDGTRLGEKEGDEPQFDPGVLTEGDLTYMYTGFCGQGDKSRHGSMLKVLDKDMLTIKKAPVIVVPGSEYSKDTEFEGHAFFEASSIRKHKDTYYFIYSSEVMHELCYATSKKPEGPFTYGGVLVSNCDLHIGSYKDAEMPSAYGANNHGSMVQIGADWYIFYHRHTNGNWFSRQGCAEKISINDDSSIDQVEMTSCGLNGGPLTGVGEYPAYIACNIFTNKHSVYVEGDAPRIVQEGGDGFSAPGYIKAITDSTVIGFKYFDLHDVTGLRIKTRAYFNGTFDVLTGINDKPVGTIKAISSNIWTTWDCHFDKLSKTTAIYLRYHGTGSCSLSSIEFLHD